VDQLINIILRYKLAQGGIGGKEKKKAWFSFSEG
jgi:hypothetical protein